MFYSHFIKNFIKNVEFIKTLLKTWNYSFVLKYIVLDKLQVKIRFNIKVILSICLIILSNL